MMDANAGTDVTLLVTEMCWTLLRSTDIGRLAVTLAAGNPGIFPVTYVVDHGTIVFHTAEGTKLSGAISGHPVAFEVDGKQPNADQAWSVVVKGGAAHVRTSEEMIDPTGLPLSPWQGGRKDHFVRIVPDEVSGSRFPIVDRTVWDPPPTPEPGADFPE